MNKIIKLIVYVIIGLVQGFTEILPISSSGHLLLTYSFLNVSTKLLNYEIVDNTLKLNFNNMILNDVTSNNILEEVVYTIG